MKPITIDRALTDRNLLGAELGPLESWQTWLIALKGAFGLALSDAERKVLAAIAGNRNPPAKRVRELWCIVGRRGGKSRIAAALACYFALFVQHNLAHGKRGMVLVLAASRDQAQVVFDYVVGYFDASPVLRQEVASRSASEIRLRNGVVIAVHANSFRTVRGRTLLCCIFDETAFWRDEESATPDVEVYRAVLPTMMTTGGMLISISTPYRRVGLLHQKHREHFGQDGDDVLVVQGASATFNPLLTPASIEALRAADPEGALAELDAEFRSDIAAFLPDELIERAIDHDRVELPPRRGFFYRAYVDASGGVGRDSYTVAIGHSEGYGWSQRYIIDLVRGTAGAFDPDIVTAQYASLCKEFGIRRVTGDFYAAQWVGTTWSRVGISYERSELPNSQVYLKALPCFTRGVVSLPNHARLLRELRLLEQRE